jgi:hypothetical protein
MGDSNCYYSLIPLKNQGVTKCEYSKIVGMYLSHTWCHQHLTVWINVGRIFERNVDEMRYDLF